jgi:hypothetical protein
MTEPKKKLPYDPEAFAKQLVEAVEKENAECKDLEGTGEPYEPEGELANINPLDDGHMTWDDEDASLEAFAKREAGGKKDDEDDDAEAE